MPRDDVTGSASVLVTIVLESVLPSNTYKLAIL